jgi:hypothetical protein
VVNHIGEVMVSIVGNDTNHYLTNVVWTLYTQGKDTNHYFTDVVDHCTLKVTILTITSPMWLTIVVNHIGDVMVSIFTLSVQWSTTSVT